MGCFKLVWASNGMLKFEVIVRIEFELNTYPYSKKITRCLFIILSRTLFLVDLNGLGPFLRVGNRFVITTEIQAGYSYSPSTVCKSGSKMFWPCNRSSGSTFLVYIGKFPGRTRKVSLVPQFFYHCVAGVGSPVVGRPVKFERDARIMFVWLQSSVGRVTAARVVNFLFRERIGQFAEDSGQPWSSVAKLPSLVLETANKSSCSATLKLISWPIEL